MIEGYNIQDELERRKRELAGILPAQQEESEPVDYEVLAQQVRKDAGEQYQAQQDQARNSFLELIMRNQTLQKKAEEDAARRERETKARTTIAALGDGFAALGNLIGTVHGAPSIPLAFQTPILASQAEKDREENRIVLQRLRDNEEALRMAEAKFAASGDPFASADVKHAYNMAEIAARGTNSENVQQHIDTRTQQNNDTRTAIATMNNESRERVAAGRNATSRANTQDRIAANAGKSGSRGLTDTGRAMQIQRRAELAVVSELKKELEGRGVYLPFGWEKNWKQYVRSAPEFYRKYYKDMGWEDIGGTVDDVQNFEGKKGGFKTGGNKGNGKTGGFKK